ncbi:MAG: hypothetical protein JSS50_05470 [Proteobacteria bacterium]|nr:hypothetical protein [Pseudomonadota bacterium]
MNQYPQQQELGNNAEQRKGGVSALKYLKRATKFAGACWHYLPLLASGALLGTGVGLAAAGAPEAAITVGGSNLAMVLALAGSALFIPSMFMWHKRVKGSGVKLSIMMEPSLPIKIINAIGVAALVLSGYYATHFHIANTAAFQGLGIWESLGAQSAVAFGFGCAIGALYGLFQERTELSKKGAAFIIGSGLICSAATTVGPVLIQAMNTAAIANSPEVIAMEAMIAVSIASLVMILYRVSSEIEDRIESCQNRCASDKKSGEEGRGGHPTFINNAFVQSLNK